jgi:hypothetical protein
VVCSVISEWIIELPIRILPYSHEFNIISNTSNPYCLLPTPYSLSLVNVPSF